MSYRNVIRKLKSLTVLTLGGTAAFTAIGIYRGDEKFHCNILMPAIHFALEPENAHKFAILTAKWSMVPRSKFEDVNVLSTTVWGLKFKNPIGIAAGFDKDGDAVDGLFRIGIGFLEVGSVTPLPQEGNQRPRVFRLREDEAVINRYGFNSRGHEYVKSRLQLHDKGDGILGVNLGKNKLSMSAASDYTTGIREFCTIADYLVINVSSPNTPGLRSLQNRSALEDLLDEVMEAKRTEILKAQMKAPKTFPPILIKIAPDLTDEEKKDIARVATRKGKKIDGLIVCNTTVSRPDYLQSEQRHEIGGLSGKPLRDLSTNTIRDMYQLTKGEVPIIAVGGVFSGEDAYEKICVGASLVQIYTALIYNGPPVIDKIKKELRDILLSNGFSNVQEAVGSYNNRRGKM